MEWCLDDCETPVCRVPHFSGGLKGFAVGEAMGPFQRRVQALRRSGTERHVVLADWTHFRALTTPSANSLGCANELTLDRCTEHRFFSWSSGSVQFEKVLCPVCQYDNKGERDGSDVRHGEHCIFCWCCRSDRQDARQQERCSTDDRQLRLVWD
jgi:hypothetical protein